MKASYINTVYLYYLFIENYNKLIKAQQIKYVKLGYRKAEN